MGNLVLLHSERRNHRILKARLTQRNDTGLGFYVKGTQEQNLTVNERATFQLMCFIDSWRKLQRIHENCHAVHNFLLEKGGICKPGMRRNYGYQTDLAAENSEWGNVAMKETVLSIFLVTLHSLFVCVCEYSVYVLRHNLKYGVCMMHFKDHSKNTKNNSYIILRRRGLAYLQVSVWRMPSASVFSKHCTRSPVQAMRQDWIQVACLAGEQRQQQGFVAWTGNTFVRCSVGVVPRMPTKFLRTLFSCFEGDQDLELK